MRLFDLVLICPFLQSIYADPLDLLDRAIANLSLPPTDQICAICFEETFKPFYFFNCSHVDFHSTCVYGYERTALHPVCPLCRSQTLPPLQSLHYAQLHIRQNNINPFLELIKAHRLSDEQTVQLIATSLSSNAYIQIISSLSLRDWGCIRYLFFDTFIHVSSLPLTSDHTLIRAMLDLGSITSAHVDMHTCCILKRYWNCSQQFLDYYSQQDATVDILSPFSKAVLLDASQSTMRSFLSLPEPYLPISMLFRVLRVAVDLKSWDSVATLLKYIKTRNANVISIIRFILQRAPDMPASSIMSVLLSPPRYTDYSLIDYATVVEGMLLK